MRPQYPTMGVLGQDEKTMCKCWPCMPFTANRRDRQTVKLASDRGETWIIFKISSHIFAAFFFLSHGGRSSVVRASVLKSEEPGFDPLVRQGEGQFFCPSELTHVQTCFCLTPFMCTARTKNCAHVKDPIFICRWKHENTAHRIKKKVDSASIWLLTFLRESSLKCPCIALVQESYLIWSDRLKQQSVCLSVCDRYNYTYRKIAYCFILC